MKKLIKPKRLMPGDKVAVVSLSWGGASVFPLRYEFGRKQLEREFRLEVVDMPHATKPADWISKNPQARAEDLMRALEDRSISAIISAIGGEDSIRLLPHVPLSVITENPKIFLGYSDSSVTHFMFHKAGVVSFYGPNILGSFAEGGGMHRYARHSLNKVLFDSSVIGEISPNEEGWASGVVDWGDLATCDFVRPLRKDYSWRWLQGEGRVQGPLLGGCIEVVDWLRGTPVWPEPSAWEGAILFLETSTDMPEPWFVKRVFRSMAACGALTSVGAILLGRPGGAMDPSKFDAYDQAVLEVVVGDLGLSDVPVVTCMDFGHTDPIMTLPYGVEAEIDCQKRTFTILESAVV